MSLLRIRTRLLTRFLAGKLAAKRRPDAARGRTPLRLELLEDRRLPAIGFQILTPLHLAGAPGGVGGVDSAKSSSLAAADFNKDGKPDLAVMDRDHSSVAILLGIGDGSFKPGGSPLLGMGPHAVAVGDFNGDGNADLVVTQGGSGNQPDGGVAVLLGKGDGTFQAPVHYPVTAATAVIQNTVAGNFNGDDKLDLAVLVRGFGQGNDFVSILLGNGDGTFQAPAGYAVGSSPAALAAADFNGDGKLDLVTANANDLSVLLGKGDGTFQSAVSYATHPFAFYEAVLVGDLNGDGKPDLVAPGFEGVTLLGNGDGTFQAPVAAPLGFAAAAPADLDGDGKPDLVGSNGGPGDAPVRVVLGNGDGTFGAPVVYPTEIGFGATVAALVVGDFNGDGVPDTVTANDVDLLNPPGSIAVLLGGNRHAATSTTSVTALPSPVLIGRPMILTATVTPGAAGAATPTGTVAFRELVGLQACKPTPVPTPCQGTVSAGTAPVGANGQAVLVVVAPANLVSVIASYGGDGNFTPSTSTAVALTSAQAPPVGGDTLERRWVAQLYTDLLRRPAGDNDLAYWGGLLDHGQTRPQVALGIATSQESRSRVVRQLYADLLHRQAGDADLNYWLGVLAGGGTTLQVEAAILGSQEYFVDQGNTAANFISAVYRDVLHRDAGPGELQAWGQILASNPDRAAAAFMILASFEADKRMVQTLYQQLLHHDLATPLDDFLAFSLEQGGTREQVIAFLVGVDPEYYDSINHDLEQRYVARLYQDLLQRPATNQEAGYWVDQMNLGVFTVQQVVGQIEASTEYRTLLLQQAYGKYLHRAADPPEVTFFLSGLGAGGTIEQVGAALTGSQEYFQQHGGTADGFLQALYQDVLGRDPDEAGRFAFGQALAQGAIPADVAAVLFGSDEYHRRVVRELYTRVLHRDADADGLAIWTTALNQGARDDQVLVILASSEEYFAQLA